jgi:hypothetical protein
MTLSTSPRTVRLQATILTRSLVQAFRQFQPTRRRPVCALQPLPTASVYDYRAASGWGDEFLSLPGCPFPSKWYFAVHSYGGGACLPSRRPTGGRGDSILGAWFLTESRRTATIQARAYEFATEWYGITEGRPYRIKIEHNMCYGSLFCMLNGYQPNCGNRCCYDPVFAKIYCPPNRWQDASTGGMSLAHEFGHHMGCPTSMTPGRPEMRHSRMADHATFGNHNFCVEIDHARDGTSSVPMPRLPCGRLSSMQANFSYARRKRLTTIDTRTELHLCSESL